MSRWSKKAAIARMQSNTRLSEIIQIDPRIQYFIDQAVRYKFTSPYEPIWIYHILRNNIQNLVGFHAALPELRNSADYLIIIDTLDDLLKSPQAANKKPPIPHWTKEDAIHRLNTNKRLAEILEAEPRINKILDRAIRQRTNSFSQCIGEYAIMRNQLNDLVGWNAADPSIRTSEDYDTVLDTVLDLLDLLGNIPPEISKDIYAYLGGVYGVFKPADISGTSSSPQKELTDDQI